MQKILNFVKHIILLIRLRQYKSLWRKITLQYRFHAWKQERIKNSKLNKLLLYKKLACGGVYLKVKNDEIKTLFLALKFKINENAKIIFTDDIHALQNVKNQELVIFLDFLSNQNNEVNALVINKKINFVLTSNLAQYSNLNTDQIFYYDSIASNFYIGRLLLAIDLISFEQFMCYCDELEQFRHSDKICLSLPEYSARYNYIQNLLATTDLKSYNFVQVIGLRHLIGWIGCGLSYKYLFSKSIQFGHQQMTIAEDDITLELNFVGKYNALLNYLDSVTNWDIFNGYTFLNSWNKLSLLSSFNGINLYTTPKFMSTVFNIYNQSAINIGSQWDNNIREQENAIDGYLNQRVSNVIISEPFIIGHNNSLDSVLWNNSNEFIYNHMIAENSMVTKNVDNS